MVEKNSILKTTTIKIVVAILGLIIVNSTIVLQSGTCAFVELTFFKFPAITNIQTVVRNAIGQFSQLNKIKEVKLTLGLITLANIYSCSTKTQQTESKFDGMWRLDKFESFDSLANRWTVDSTRVGWNGYILYDGQGHMGVHLIPKGYYDFDTNKNMDSLQLKDLKELAKFYKSNFVYFANYNLSGTAINHKRLTATEPESWGTTLTRDFDFMGDTLILTARESIAGQKLRLRWIKL